MINVDKYEYNLKLEEIDKLVDQKDYEEAARLADTIDWRRVRNVRTLCLISEIYEAAKRPEDAKTLLLRAYRRAPNGRTILYRLVEITTELKQYDEALEFYNEYVQVAPHDNSRYILRYKIYRGRGAKDSELIEILEEYLGQEYTEKWAYELAKLYQQSGQTQKCLATCDDLVLWFHSGKYVRKALELKKKYAALTPKQQEILEKELAEPEEEQLPPPQQEEAAPEGETADVKEEFGTIKPDGEVITEAIIADTEKEIADEVTAHKEAQDAAPDTNEQLQQATRTMPGKPEIDAARAGAGKAEITESQKETADAVKPETEAVSETAEAEETAAHAAAEGIKAEARSAAEAPAEEKAAVMPEAEAAVKETESAGLAAETESEADSAEAAGGEAEEPEDGSAEAESDGGFDEKSLQLELARSMREIISGVTKQPETEEEIPAYPETRNLKEMPKIERRETAEPDEQRISIDDVLLSMGEHGRKLAEAVNREKEKITVTKAAQEELSDAQKEALQYSTDPEKVLRKRKNLPTYQEEGRKDISSSVNLEDAVNAVTDRMTEDELMKNGTAGKTAESRPAAETSTDAAAESAGQKSAQELQKTREFDPVKHGGIRNILKEKTIRIPVEEVAKERFRFLRRREREHLEENIPEETVNPVLPNEEDIIAAAEAVGTKAAEEAGQAQAAAEAETAQVSEAAGAGETAETAETAEEGYDAAENEAAGEFEEQQAAEEETAEEMTEETAAETDADEEPYDEAAEQSAEEEMTDEEYDEYDEEPLDEADILPPDIRPLFYGFTETPGVEKQISDAIWQAADRGEDRTSRSGNILILGPHCSGKTTLAMNLAKAVAQERGNDSMKIAKIYAADFNRKDIASTIAKIAGGALIIEEAGDLEPSAIEQLTTAMEFRTDQLLVILEDEQQYIHDLLMRHPRFTMKFTSQIYLPVYGAEELISFAQLFANEQDCVISEDGEEKVRQKISAIAEQGETVSLADINEMVNHAVARSSKFLRKLTMGKKRYDENDFIVLYAKDFK